MSAGNAVVVAFVGPKRRPPDLCVSGGRRCVGHLREHATVPPMFASYGAANHGALDAVVPHVPACSNWPLLCKQAWSIELMHQGAAWSGGLLLRSPPCSLTHRTDDLGRGGGWGSKLPGLSGHPAGFYAGELVFLLTGCYGECVENGARRIWGAAVWCGSCQAIILI